MAADFFRGMPVLEPDFYLAREMVGMVQDQPQDPAPIKLDITYNQLTLTDILRQNILKYDMRLSRFLHDLVQNSKLEALADENEEGIVYLKDLIGTGPFNDTKISEPEDVSVASPTPVTNVAPDTAQAPADEQIAAEDESNPAPAGRHKKRNARRRALKQTRTGNNNDGGEEFLTGVSHMPADPSENEPTQIEKPADADYPAPIKEPTSVGESTPVDRPSQIDKPSQVNETTPFNKTTEIGKSSQVDKIVEDEEQTAVGELTDPTPSHETTLFDEPVNEHGKFNYDDFHSLYDISDDENDGQWHVVRSKSSKKFDKLREAQDSESASREIANNQGSSGGPSGTFGPSPQVIFTHTPSLLSFTTDFSPLLE